MSDWSWSPSVTGIKSTLQWESLQERRARARVVIFHKIQYSLVAIPMTLFQHTPSTITTRGAPKKFVVPFCRIQAHKTPLSPLPLSSGTPCRQVSLLSQTLILSAGHSLWGETQCLAVPPPPPVPVFKSHCTCTIFIIFLPALLSPFCTSFLTSRSCDNMPTAPYNYTYRYRYRYTVRRPPCFVNRNVRYGSQGTYRVYASFKRALKIIYSVENYNHNMLL